MGFLLVVRSRFEACSGRNSLHPSAAVRRGQVNGSLGGVLFWILALGCLVIGAWASLLERGFFKIYPAALREVVDVADLSFPAPFINVSIHNRPEGVEKRFLSINRSDLLFCQHPRSAGSISKNSLHPILLIWNEEISILRNPVLIVRHSAKLRQAVQQLILHSYFINFRRSLANISDNCRKHMDERFKFAIFGNLITLFPSSMKFRRPDGGSDSNPSAFAILRCSSLMCDSPNSTAQDDSLNKTDNYKPLRKSNEFPLHLYVFASIWCLGIECLGAWLIASRRRYFVGGLMVLVGLLGFLSVETSLLFCDPFFWRALSSDYPSRCDKQNQKKSQSSYNGHELSVTQKYPLTSSNYCNTVIAIGRAHMANILSTDKQIAVISALAEGSGIRQIERITGVHRDTIMRLGVRVGKGCAALLDAKMRNLPCHQLQFDELWGFIGKKERHCTPDDSLELGDVWTFCAIDAETKIVPSFKCGKRDLPTANAFVADVASRMRNRVQISSDALRAYVDAIEMNFGANVDFAQIIKTYVTDDSHVPERRFSAPEIVVTEKKSISGFPDLRLASTSHVERLNGTTRLHMRRLTRLTYAFSKKLENFEAAVALHFAYYNFVKRHITLRATPAMAAGIERDFWTVGNLIEAAA
jgi:IS1 family transposase